MKLNCLIQGYQGSFHEEAMNLFFKNNTHNAIPCDSFDVLAKSLKSKEASVALMAIENSIAGSILQNYRILREYDFQIVGEQYLRIQHQLMALPGQKLEQIREVISHPMAINQCLSFLDRFPYIQRKEYSDTALAAMDIAENKRMGVAAIGSKLAAQKYGLEILGENIETDDANYTRFFVLQNRTRVQLYAIDKASIYLRVKDEPGALLKALNVISEHKINLSKLQSFPVLGVLKEYYFHLDLEFETHDQYLPCIQILKNTCVACEVLGEYKRDHIEIKKIKSKSVV